MSYINKKVEIVRPKVPFWLFLTDYDVAMSRFFGQPRLAKWIVGRLISENSTYEQAHVTYCSDSDEIEFSLGGYTKEFRKMRSEVQRYVWREVKRNFKGQRLTIHFNPYYFYGWPEGGNSPNLKGKSIALYVELNHWPAGNTPIPALRFSPDVSGLSDDEKRKLKEEFVNYVPQLAEDLIKSGKRRHTYKAYRGIVYGRSPRTGKVALLGEYPGFLVIGSDHTVTDVRLMTAFYLYSDDLYDMLWHEIDKRLLGLRPFDLDFTSRDYVYSKPLMRNLPRNVEVKPWFVESKKIRRLVFQLELL